MSHKLFVCVLLIAAIFLNSCKDGCVICSGPTASQEQCPGDFADKIHFQNFISEYEQEGGICDEK